MRKPVESSDLAALEAVLAAIGAANAAVSVDLTKLAEEIEAGKTDRERMADALERNVPRNADGQVRNAKKLKGKRADGKRRVSPLKKHWKTMRKIERVRKNKENARRLGRRKAKGIEWLRDGTAEGLWSYLTIQGKWGRAAWRPLWKIDKRHFMEFIYPHVAHCVPQIYRHDTRRAVTMRNSVWKDGKTVLFDGADWYLEKHGWTLSDEEASMLDAPATEAISAQMEGVSPMIEHDVPVCLERNW